MKKILYSILSAFMVSTMASAQYLNVKLKDGTYSFKTSSDMEVSFGAKKGFEPTESAQTVTVNGHTVTVKLADDILANDVALNVTVEENAVKIKAVSVDGYGLESTLDNNEVLVPTVDNGISTFTISDMSGTVTITIGYITVRFDLNNSNIMDKFMPKPADMKMGYNSTIPPTYASAEGHSFRGWYTDKECKSPWNYSTGVTKSMTLYAKWAKDPTGTQINDHDFVKLGGYYWATENVGACHIATAVASPETYGNNRGFYFYKKNDALSAAKSFGVAWTLPSEAQWQALIDYCDWTWTTDDETGMNGMLVKGREGTYESEHRIFLPAAGIYLADYGFVDDQGYYGFYWSTDLGRSLYFNDGDRRMDDFNPNEGMAVRPVSE